MLQVKASSPVIWHRPADCGAIRGELPFSGPQAIVLRAAGRRNVITFLCPNGHKLSCPEQQAGRAGQCPDCGARFRIPAGAAAPVPNHNPVAMADSHSGDHGFDQVVFLCPNGHRLHGPNSLAGKAGQCPHCGAKFRIPPLVEEAPAPVTNGVATNEPSAEQMSTDAEIPLEEIEEIPDEPVEKSVATKPSPAVDVDDLDFAALERLVQSSSGGLSDDRVAGVDEVHPLASLLEQLWGKQDKDAVVEIRLESGETLVPQFYSADRSRLSHAFLAIREPDGKHSLIVVPWESVSRVTIRGLEELPEGFD